MIGVPTDVPAAQRAQWLAELSEALDQASELLDQLGISDERCPDLLELQLRIDAARLEVQSLRLSRSLRPRRNPDPEWIKSAPWAEHRLD